MADQTNAEVSDERLREIIDAVAGPFIAVPDATSIRLPASELKALVLELITRRSVTSQASEGEVVGYQRRLRNTREDVAHKYGTAYPKGVWGKWSECTEAQYRYSLAHGRVESFPDYLEAEVRPVFASPSERVERLETANRALAEIKESFRIAGLGTIGAHWQTRIDAIDQTLAPFQAAAVTVTDEMVERACKAHAPQWPGIDAEIKVYARQQMRAALEAALRSTP